MTLAVLSGSRAIMLDGLFNLTFFLTCLFTLKIARLVSQGDDDLFPMGYGFFEPLVNGFKGVLILGVSVMALLDAVAALASGGRNIAAGLATAYGVFAAVTCWSVALLIRRQGQRSGSPLVQTDAASWQVNAAISTAVLLTFIGLFLIRGTPLEPWAPYVDPALVLLVVLISLGVPVRMAWRALMELLNHTPSPDLLHRVRSQIEAIVEGLPVEQLNVRVIQPGRTRMVAAHVVLAKDYRPDGLETFDRLRATADQALRADYPHLLLDMVFTADPRWGAPLRRADGD